LENSVIVSLLSFKLFKFKDIVLANNMGSVYSSAVVGEEVPRVNSSSNPETSDKISPSFQPKDRGPEGELAHSKDKESASYETSVSGCYLPDYVFVVDGSCGVYYTDSEEEAENFVATNMDSDCVGFILNGWTISNDVDKKECRKTFTVYGEKTNSGFFGFGRTHTISQYSIHRVPRLVPTSIKEEYSTEVEDPESGNSEEPGEGKKDDRYGSNLSPEEVLPVLSEKTDQYKVYSLIDEGGALIPRLDKSFKSYDEAIVHVKVMNMIHSELPRLLASSGSQEERDSVINRFCFGDSHLGLQKYFLGLPELEAVKKAREEIITNN